VYNIIGKQQKTPKREADHITRIADEMHTDKSISEKQEYFQQVKSSNATSVALQ
jgi:hypothetical protein